MTTQMQAPRGDTAAVRAAAIEASGWGARFTFIQPRNLAFWVYLLIVGAGVVAYVDFFPKTYAAYSQAVTLAVVWWGLYAAIFWWFTQHIDRYAAQPVKLMITAFVWGAFAATWPMAAPANDAIRALYAQAFGQPWALDWGAGLAAPFTEELSKGLGLLLLIALAPRLVRTAFDGFILGAFLGLGFQILEDISYVANSAGTQFGANQIGAAMQTFIMRTVVGVAAHVLYSAIFCAGLVYFLGRPAEPRRRGRGLALMGVAMLLHGLWDDASGLSFGNSIALWSLLILILGASLATVYLVFRMTVRSERDFLRDVMAPELEAGVVTKAELVAMCGDRKARRRFVHSGEGHAGRRRNKHRLEGGFDLAREIGESSGVETERTAYARAELARLGG